MKVFNTYRDIAASVDEVFAAIASPERLARWWGPEGFTNTFEVCEFVPGGRWVFTMHAPDGRGFPNEASFAAITAPHSVVIAHTNEPHFVLILALTPIATGTRVYWTQTFESAEVGEKVAHIVKPSNEQNLDRWAAEVARVAVKNAG